MPRYEEEEEFEEQAFGERFEEEDEEEEADGELGVDEVEEDDSFFSDGEYSEDDEAGGEDEEGDDDLEALIELGEELAESGELRRALRLWRKAVDRFPEEQEVWFRLGQACFRVIEDESSHHDIWEDDAELQGLHEEALTALDESITIDDRHHHSWNLLGALYMLRKNPQSAVECWEKSLQIKSGQKQVKQDLEEARAELGE